MRRIMVVLAALLAFAATSPARIANSIADRLEKPVDPQQTEILTFAVE